MFGLRRTNSASAAEFASPHANKEHFRNFQDCGSHWDHGFFGGHRTCLEQDRQTREDIYTEVAFPVPVNNRMAIPPGTYVQGQIDTLTRPGLFSPHAQFQIHFTKLIFANGYTVLLGDAPNAPAGQSPTQPASTPPHASNSDVIPAVANVYVEVSAANDILLDNGTQIDMVLQLPLRLDAASVSAAVSASHPVQLAQFKSATLCRPIPATSGTPGTPDTVIPGTPGTPPTVIPGGPGMPPTVIPGTPGTPDTVIPGTPGTPDTSEILCPGPPLVTANPKPQSYKELFQIIAPVQIAGKQLSAGSYQVSWKGLGPSAQVDILQNGKLIFSVQARIVLLNRQSPATLPGTRTNPDGSVTLRSLRFAAQAFALYFDQRGA